MVNVDCALQFTIFVNHLILVGYATHTIGSFPSRRQLRGTFWGCGEREDQATDLIEVGGRCGWRDGHLLMGELEPLSNGLYVIDGILEGWRGACVRGEVGRKRWFATSSDHRGRECVGLMGHCVEGQHYPLDLVHPGFGGGILKQSIEEHVIQGPVAPLVDGVAFRVIRRGEDLLYSKRAQEFGPYGTDELTARSERSLRGVPKYGITCHMRASLTVLAVWLLDGMRMVYFE